ncbi:MAG: tetratricopeptide repeat protein [Bacteroidota bacterium]
MNSSTLKAPQDKSIAVLPFVNMSREPDNEYFSDGITEEIINALTKVSGLKVIARTSSFAFKGKNIDVRKIGQELGVTTILEGSVRQARNRVRITAQLVSAGDGTHFWSKNFDRELEDIFALQDEISLLIADQIRENFGHFDIQDQLIEAPTQNIEAYNLYLKGRYHHLRWNAKDLRQAIAFYKQSIELDPDFAMPYFGVSLSCSSGASWGLLPYEEGIAEAEHFLQKGLELEEHSFIGFYSKATISFFAKRNFRESHQYLHKAIVLNPSFTDAEEGLAEIYTAIGAFDKALKYAQNTITLNPLSPNHYFTLGNIHYLLGDYEKAIESMQKALRIDPEFALAIETIALCYIQLKAYEQLEDFLSRPPLVQHPDYCRALYQLVHADEGFQVDIESLKIHLQSDPGASLITWRLYLNIYLGNHELALDILEEGVHNHTGQYINFTNDPFQKPLRQYQRFQKLLKTTFPPSKLPIEEAKKAAASPAQKSIMSPAEVAQYLRGLTNLLEDEEAYLDPNMSLKVLAAQVNIHPNKLSWLLNEHIGKNFNEFINSYRLAAFKQKALDASNSHLTLLALAYESGFNSKTVFNAFFKKIEKTTPRAWLKAQQA